MDTKCNAELHIDDDHDDNFATMRCQLDKGHAGLHREEYSHRSSGTVVITWENDERAPVLRDAAGRQLQVGDRVRVGSTDVRGHVLMLHALKGVWVRHKGGGSSWYDASELLSDEP
jgi:hypothetical protein